jgi:hypothetical protein
MATLAGASRRWVLSVRAARAIVVVLARGSQKMIASGNSTTHSRREGHGDRTAYAYRASHGIHAIRTDGVACAARGRV